MKEIKYKEYSFNIPESWEDVTLKYYSEIILQSIINIESMKEEEYNKFNQEITQLENNLTQQSRPGLSEDKKAKIKSDYKILQDRRKDFSSNITVLDENIELLTRVLSLEIDEVKSLPMSLIDLVLEQLKFLNTNNFGDSDRIIIEDKEYIIPEYDNLTLGQNIALEQATKFGNLVKLFNVLLNIDLSEMGMDKVFPLINNFNNKKKDLIKSINIYILQELKMKEIVKSLQNLENKQKIME